MDSDWCTVCDKHIDVPGKLYCSQVCRDSDTGAASISMNALSSSLSSSASSSGSEFGSSLSLASLGEMPPAVYDWPQWSPAQRPWCPGSPIGYSKQSMPCTATATATATVSRFTIASLSQPPQLTAPLPDATGQRKEPAAATSKLRRVTATTQVTRMISDYSAPPPQQQQQRWTSSASGPQRITRPTFMVGSPQTASEAAMLFA